MKKQRLIPYTLALILIFTQHSAGEQNATSANEAAQYYLANACHSCHGIYGEGIGSSPRLAGVNERYLATRLRALKEGKTRTSFGGVMVSFAKAMDEKMITAMARYLATMKKNEPEERYEEDEFDVTS